MPEVEMRYSDLRPLDTVVWRPPRGRLAAALLRAFSVSSFTEAAVFLGQMAPGAAAWFVPGRVSRVCAIPYEATDEAPEVYVVRPRGPSKSVMHAEVVELALDMAAEPPGSTGRRVSVDRWANAMMWLPFKVDSALYLWGGGLAGLRERVGEFESFEALVGEGLAEEIGRSKSVSSAAGGVQDEPVEDAGGVRVAEQDDAPPG